MSHQDFKNIAYARCFRHFAFALTSVVFVFVIVFVIVFVFVFVFLSSYDFLGSSHHKLSEYVWLLIGCVKPIMI